MEAIKRPLKDETLGGLAAAPLNFTPTQGFIGVNCIYYKLENKTVIAPDGFNAQCMPAT